MEKQKLHTEIEGVLFSKMDKEFKECGKFILYKSKTHYLITKNSMKAVLVIDRRDSSVKESKIEIKEKEYTLKHTFSLIIGLITINDS